MNVCVYGILVLRHFYCVRKSYMIWYYTCVRVGGRETNGSEETIYSPRTVQLFGRIRMFSKRLKAKRAIYLAPKTPRRRLSSFFKHTILPYAKYTAARPRWGQDYYYSLRGYLPILYNTPRRASIRSGPGTRMTIRPRFKSVLFWRSTHYRRPFCALIHSR